MRCGPPGSRSILLARQLKRTVHKTSNAPNQDRWTRGLFDDLAHLIEDLLVALKLSRKPTNK